jgi:hypothetical protein
MREYSDEFDKQDTPVMNEQLTLRGKSAEEVQAYLLSGESDDLSIEYTNILNFY